MKMSLFALVPHSSTSLAKTPCKIKRWQSQVEKVEPSGIKPVTLSCRYSRSGLHPFSTTFGGVSVSNVTATSTMSDGPPLLIWSLLMRITTQGMKTGHRAWLPGLNICTELYTMATGKSPVTPSARITKQAADRWQIAGWHSHDALSAVECVSFKRIICAKLCSLMEAPILKISADQI